MQIRNYCKVKDEKCLEVILKFQNRKRFFLLLILLFSQILISTWLLYILRYGSLFQLVFRWFSKLTVVSFSCNFGMVMGGGEHSVDLLCHLDQNSLEEIFWGEVVGSMFWVVREGLHLR